MPTDREFIKRAQKGQYGSLGASTPNAEVDKMHQRRIVVRTILDAAASTVNVLSLGVMDRAVKVVSCKFICDGAVTAHDTNFKTLSVEKTDTAGGAFVVIASISTTVAGTGNIVALIPETLTLTAANAEVAAGGQLVFRTAVGASGVVVPAGTVEVVYEEI